MEANENRGAVAVQYFAALLGAYAISCACVPHALANRFVSSLNAVIIFSLAAHALVDAEHAISDAPPLAHAAISLECVCAYLVYDSLIGLVRGFESSPILMLVHHGVGLASELLTLSTGFGAYCTLVIHLAEASTPLLHLSWLLLKRGRGGTRLFLVVSHALVATFALTRVVSPAVLLFGYQLGSAASAHWGKHRVVYRLHLGVTTVFWALNCFWFTKLLQASKGLPRTSGRAARHDGTRGRAESRSNDGRAAAAEHTSGSVEAKVAMASGVDVVGTATLRAR
jgi:hypothetical protein